MPAIPRKVVVCADLGGVVIQPLSQKGQKPFQSVKIKYGETAVSPVSRDQVPDVLNPKSSTYEAFGIVGLITIANRTYLVTITRRQQVAQVFGYPVYVVTDVATTPCSSKQEAEESVISTAAQLDSKAPRDLEEGAESSDDDLDLPDNVVDEVGDDDDDDTPSSQTSTPNPTRTSFAEDVMHKRGTYGRFAQRWFSRSGWTLDQRRTLGLSNSTLNATADTKRGVSTLSVSTVPSLSDNGTESQPSTLLPKLLHTVRVLFGSSRSFFFSYDVDITRNLAKQPSMASSDMPLHLKVDETFFWNRHILLPFLDAGQDSFVLPLMQGFVGQRAFVVDKEPPQTDEVAKNSLELQNMTNLETTSSSVQADRRASSELRPSQMKYLITLISRRSTKRAGLRYLRRGVNEEGFTANTVETEQLLSSPTWDESLPVHSFLQIRGSIPLFFTQSAYALKPAPHIQHSTEANYAACKRHFESIKRRYGAIQVVNLVEKHGIEAPIGTEYQKAVVQLNEGKSEAEKVPFEWFDFHHACRGMKFENVSHLVLSIKDELSELGSSTLKDGSLVETQKGVFRTNCMDCLDRTNVCQSSFAKHMLDIQLREEGIDMSAQADQVTTWFNTLWADNGDAVSKQYASTAAMKGDYTRTKKRDYRGALNDLGLSLARLYSGMVNDYFSQTAIDFLLGNVTAKIFDEFEADMMTKDPAVSVTKMRDRAIDLCQKRVVADEKEDFHGGWVLLSPSNSGNRTGPMEDVVLLLTDSALYTCRFDWDLDKVASFERVQLGSITHIKFGTYITSTISSSYTDEMSNVGFVLSYQPKKDDIKRTNTRTLSNLEIDSKPKTQQELKKQNRTSGIGSFFSAKPKGPAVKEQAFKAPYVDSSTSSATNRPHQTEIQQVVTICADIERLVLDGQLGAPEEGHESIIEKGDVISLEAAKRNTGLLEQLGHSIKKLVWA